MRANELSAIIQENGSVIYIDDKIEGVSYIAWHTLLPFQGDLKKLSSENSKRLLISMLTKGFFDIKKVWRNAGVVYLGDGHQTIETLNQLRPEIGSGQIKMLRRSDNQPTDLIPCVAISAKDDKDFAEKILLINSNFGQLTQEGLRGFVSQYNIQHNFFNIAVITEWVTPQIAWETPISTWENEPINEPKMIEHPQKEVKKSPEKESPNKEIYTSKIRLPIYEPSEQKPHYQTCLNTSKRDELLAEIAACEGISNEDKTLLIGAAQRHLQFDYGKIADYYANSPKIVQDLMEKSALVIIDYNRAYELGYHKLGNNIAEIIEDE